MGNKTKRLVSIEGGYFIKPSMQDEPSSTADKQKQVDVLCKRTGFMFMNGTPKISYASSSEQQEFLGGVKYPVDKSSKGSTMHSISPYSVMANFTKKNASTSEPGMTMLEQCGGVMHAIKSFNNTQKNSGNNGYVFGYTTDSPDYWKGASPMKVVGLTLRVWCNRYTSEYTHNGNQVAEKGQKEVTADCFINMMHAVYIKPNGSKYNKELLPEGNNSGTTKFYRKAKLSDNYDNLSFHTGKAYKNNCNPQGAKLIRVWHKDNIPDGDCFMGFYVSWGIGTVADQAKWHNLIFGGVAPILETDLELITPNKKLNRYAHTTPYMYYLTGKNDLYNYYPELDPDRDTKVGARKLWTVNDSNHTNNHGTTKDNFKSNDSFYQQSFSRKAGNMDLPDLPD